MSFPGKVTVNAGRFLFVAAAAIIIGFNSTACASGPEPRPGAVTTKTVKGAWKAASARLRSARLEYVTRVTFKVVADPTRYSASLKHLPTDEYAPSKESQTRVSIEGIKMRKEVLSKGAGRDAPLQRRELEASDGRIVKRLFMPGGISQRPYPVGNISIPRLPLALELLETSPICFVMSRCVPSISHSNMDLELFRVSGRTERLDGTDCILLELGDPKARTKEFKQNGITYFSGNPSYSQLCVAPSKDYAIMRSAKFVNGLLKWRVDLQYKMDTDGNWIPKSWTIELPRPDDRTRSEFRSSRVLKWESNAHFDRSEFDISFPADAQVQDSSHEKP